MDDSFEAKKQRDQGSKSFQIAAVRHGEVGGSQPESVPSEIKTLPAAVELQSPDEQSQTDAAESAKPDAAEPAKPDEEPQTESQAAAATADGCRSAV